MFSLRRRRRRPQEVESVKALQEATVHLQETQKRGREVSRISADLRTLRENNHFAEQLQHIIGGNS